MPRVTTSPSGKDSRNRAGSVSRFFSSSVCSNSPRNIVAANAEYRKNLESKGLTFNATKAEDFQAALAKTSFYKDAKAKFGDEAWALLQKYAGNIG